MFQFFIDVVMPVFIVVFAWWIVYLHSLIRAGLVELQLQTENEDNILGIYAERVGNQVLVYDIKTHKFLTQVKTQEELFEYFQTHEYYSTLNVIAGEDNLIEVFGLGEESANV